MTHSKTAFTLIVLVALLTLSTAAVAPAFSVGGFKDVTAPGAVETDTYGINASGVITGDYVDSAGAQHGMILRGKKLTTVDNKSCVTTPGSGATDGIQFYGINSTGVIAGWCGTTSGTTIGFTYAKGNFKNISISGSSEVEANGINDARDIVGTYFDSAGTQHGFLLVGRKLTKLDPPGVDSLATAWSINDAGVITIFGLDSTGLHYLSFTTANKGKTYKAFHAKGEGKSGGKTTSGTAIHTINNNGDLVATYFDSAGNRHGVLLHSGKQYSFDDPNGSGSTRADGLSDTLGIVGRYGSGKYGGTGFFAQAK